MYRVLESIKVNNLYKLEPYTLTPNDINLILDFINHNITEKTFMSFSKRHNNYILHALKYIPISILLNVYLDYNYLLNYITDELYSYIIKKSNERFAVRLFLEKDYLPELIKLNDFIGNIYNFSDNYLLKRLVKFKNMFDFIDWDKYYLGSDIILLLALKKQPGGIIKLYSKDKQITLKKSKYYKTLDNNYVCEYNDFTFLIHCNYYHNLGELLLEKEMIVCDKSDIYCKLETYQKLEQEIVLTPVQLNKDLLVPMKGLNARFTKYKYHKLQLSYCYVCKQYYDKELTYDRYVDMCLDCGKFNYDKKSKCADLSTCVAFVSGIRQKIGLQIALKLLRCGSKVIGTTRYHHATYYNYAKQHDFDKWKDNLIICQCDFLNLDQVKKLIAFLKTQKINIFINNACQTIRASNHYHEKLELLESTISDILPNNLIEYKQESNNNNNQIIQHNQQSSIITYKCHTNNQIILVDDKIKSLDIKFNQFNDIKDKDIKDESSWAKNIEDIDAGEILETIAINQTVPTLLINQLKKHMAKPRFIIQCTANEGTFNINKESTHAHTNMCKAAMNMLIRTISEEKEPDQYVFSVNCGFISGVNPQQDHYPLSDEDGATRILYPIIEFYSGTPLPKEIIHLRNYQSEKW